MSLDDPMPIDDDGSCDSLAEQTLAMARFHRTLLKSFEKRIKKQRKEERRIQKEKKRENTMKREEEKMQRKAKKERSKAKAKDKKEKGSEKKEKSSEKKEKDIEKKTKKKKEQLKSPKKKKKSKTITVEGSNDDSGGNFDFWWSTGIDDDNIEQDSNSNNNNKKKKKKKTRTKKKTRMVNKIPKTKKKGKTKGITMEGSEISLSEHDLTETTASIGSSHHWSVVTPVVRKTAEDSAADTTSDSTPYCWDLPPLPSMLTPEDIPLPATPKPNKNYLPLLLSPCFDSETDVHATPTATAKQKKKYLPLLLLSPRSYSDSDDSDDVSMCSEESMSEQILDDLSCILDCSDDLSCILEQIFDDLSCILDCSDEEEGCGRVSEPSPVKKEKSLRAHLDRILDCSDEDEDCVSELSHIKKEKRSSAHANCGSSLNSHKKDSDRWSHNSNDHDSRSICSVPMRLSPMRKATYFVERTDGSKLEKHLGGIKIVASRENNDQDALKVAVDGIVMVRSPRLFPKRKI